MEWERASSRVRATTTASAMTIVRWREVNGSTALPFTTTCSLLASVKRHHSRKIAPIMPGKGVRRRWYLDLHGIRREGTKATGFTYRHAGGSSIEADKTLARIRKLRIPPAWQDVRIARSDSAPLQAVGIDRKGRTQYLYHPRFRAQREEEKFKRVVEFGEALPALRRRVRADLKSTELDREHVLAAIVRLIDQGFFRVGNQRSAKSEATYGLTTIEARHVTVDGPVLFFDYIGKWQKSQTRAIEDSE